MAVDDESAIEADIDELKRQRHEIEQLDRDWELERERYMVTEKFGNRVIPSRWGSAVNAIVIVVFGIVWVAVSLDRTPIYFPIIGVLVCAAGLVACAYRYHKASEHDEAKERYQRRREALLERHDDEND